MKLLLLIGVILLTACGTTHDNIKAEPSVIDALTESGCIIKTYHQVGKHGSIKITCRN